MEFTVEAVRQQQAEVRKDIAKKLKAKRDEITKALGALTVLRSERDALVVLEKEFAEPAERKPRTQKAAVEQPPAEVAADAEGEASGEGGGSDE